MFFNPSPIKIMKSTRSHTMCYKRNLLEMRAYDRIAQINRKFDIWLHTRNWTSNSRSVLTNTKYLEKLFKTSKNLMHMLSNNNRDTEIHIILFVWVKKQFLPWQCLQLEFASVSPSSQSNMAVAFRSGIHDTVADTTVKSWKRPRTTKKVV